MYFRLISDPPYVSVHTVQPIYRAEPGSSKYRCKLNDLPYPLEMLRSKDANNGLFNVLQRIVFSLSKRPSIISKKRLKFHRGENLTREMKVKNLLLREDNGW